MRCLTSLQNTACCLPHKWVEKAVLEPPEHTSVANITHCAPYCMFQVLPNQVWFPHSKNQSWLYRKSQQFILPMTFKKILYNIQRLKSCMKICPVVMCNFEFKSIQEQPVWEQTPIKMNPWNSQICTQLDLCRMHLVLHNALHVPSLRNANHLKLMEPFQRHI